MAGPTPHWTFPFTPTSASWLNAVEGFFAILTRRRLKRGVFKGVVDLQAAINSSSTTTSSQASHGADGRQRPLRRRRLRHLQGRQATGLWNRVQGKTGAPPPKGLAKEKAEWLKPGLVGLVKFLKGEEKLRHASLKDFRQEG